MPITAVTKDPEALAMTVVAEFAATPERVWDAYTDPRQIEKFWGPEGWPAQFTRHDAHPGGQSHYAMHGPDGEVSRGYWEWLAVDAPRSFEVRDGFAKDDGSPNRDMPGMRMTFSFEPIGDRTRLTTTTYFNSAEELEQLLGMGMEEGMTSAMGQIDEVLADLRSYAADVATHAEQLSDTEVRISRIIRGSAADVWRAHHESELLKQWLLGPDGWTMPVAIVAERVGDTYRHEWAPVGGGEGFGFEGELLEEEAPYRMVTTERMIGGDGTETRNELTLTPRADGTTLLSFLITYPSKELRDMILATGMTDGMEASYQRLETVIA